MSNENDTTNDTIKAAEERGARWALDACHAAIIRCWAPPISPAGDQRARDAVRICDESRARTRAPADRASETLDRPWCAADLPAESVREGRAVSRELALDTALRGLLEVVERYKDRAVPLDAAVRVAKATRAGVADARRQEGWNA